MQWMQGKIQLEDGSMYSGEFLVKDDGQLDNVFHPDFNEAFAAYESDEDELTWQRE